MKKSKRNPRVYSQQVNTPPDDPEQLNASRAQWAAVALDAFRRETGADREDAVSDLLADLMHWCDRFGQEFSKELRRARTHYEAETGLPSEMIARLSDE